MTQYFATRRNTRDYYLAYRFYLSMLYNKNATCRTLSLHLLNSHSAQVTFTLNFSNCPFVLTFTLVLFGSKNFRCYNLAPFHCILLLSYYFRWICFIKLNRNTRMIFPNCHVNDFWTFQFSNCNYAGICTQSNSPAGTTLKFHMYKRP